VQLENISTVRASTARNVSTVKTSAAKNVSTVKTSSVRNICTVEFCRPFGAKLKQQFQRPGVDPALRFSLTAHHGERFTTKYQHSKNTFSTKYQHRKNDFRTK
jgi:hypothetical protein